MDGRSQLQYPLRFFLKSVGITNLVGPTTLMLHTYARGHWPFGSEKGFIKSFEHNKHSFPMRRSIHIRVVSVGKRIDNSDEWTNETDMGVIGILLYEPRHWISSNVVF